MIILAVHSTTPVQGLAVTSDGALLAERTIHCGRKHVEHLAPAIQETVKGLDLGLADIDGFAAAIGPGSFSGIRVGIATIKGIALALQKPVVGISSLDALAWQALRPEEVGAAVIDARRGEVYIAVYEREADRLKTLTAPALVSMKEVASLRNAWPGPFIVCGGAIIKELADLGQSLVTRVADLPSAVACAELARHQFERGEIGPLHSLAPLYIRRPDAEEKARSRVARKLG